MAKCLVKSTDRKLFGVAGGLAEYFDIDATLIRVGIRVSSREYRRFTVSRKTNIQGNQIDLGNSG